MTEIVILNAIRPGADFPETYQTAIIKTEKIRRLMTLLTSFFADIPVRRQIKDNTVRVNRIRVMLLNELMMLSIKQVIVNSENNTFPVVKRKPQYWLSYFCRKWL